MANPFIPRVVDISHYNTVRDLKQTAEAGIWGVIHKATQGRAYADPQYAAHRQAAAAAGLLWGAYHFNTGDRVDLQVDNFLTHADPDENTLLALDYEDNRLSQMEIEDAVEFLHLVEKKTGRLAVIYSGNRLKEKIHELPVEDIDYLCAHRLWLAQYGTQPRLPAGFKKYWLWQYSGDGVGPQPHNVPGIVAGNGGLDMNVYAGAREELVADWAGAPLATS